MQSLVYDHAPQLLGGSTVPAYSNNLFVRTIITTSLIRVHVTLEGDGRLRGCHGVLKY